MSVLLLKEYKEYYEEDFSIGGWGIYLWGVSI